MTRTSLEAHLQSWADEAADRRDVARIVTRLAATAKEVARVIAQGSLYGDLAAVVGNNADGDAQKALDVEADALFQRALGDAPVAIMASEEMQQPIVLAPSARFAVVIDPLDGSTNIETNLSIGTIFGIYRYAGGDPLSAVLQPGRALVAAGIFVYGPTTTLWFTAGRGTHLFTLDPESRAFFATAPAVRIPAGNPEYAINASNYRHWDEAIRAYVDDCIAGVEGPRGRNFNMRWYASLVAEASRILVRGGVFLYPADRRRGYEQGRLRLVYEANPLAFVIEQAGGPATDGEAPIRDRQPQSLHQRVPLVFGAADKVERVARYYAGLPSSSERSPLFGKRGLFMFR